MKKRCTSPTLFHVMVIAALLLVCAAQARAELFATGCGLVGKGYSCSRIYRLPDTSIFGWGGSSASGIVFGPDGNLYVADTSGNAIQRFDPASGALIDAFIPAGSTGLAVPSDLTFGPDGNLYVIGTWNGGSDRLLLRFDGTTGQFIDVFSYDGRPIGPSGLEFGPDGNLYVGSADTNQVLRYDGATGAFMGPFVATGASSLTRPLEFLFGPDGNLYVSSYDTDEVLKYDGATGAFLSAFVTAGSGGLAGPVGLAFGDDGAFYVSSFRTDCVLRYDGTTGAFTYIYTRLAQYSSPQFIAWRPSVQPRKPTVSLSLSLSTLSIAAMDRLTVTADLTNGPTIYYTDIYLWLMKPSHDVVSITRRRDIRIPGGFHLTRSVNLGLAGQGRLDQLGRYVVGARVVDSSTGALLSQWMSPFTVSP